MSRWTDDARGHLWLATWKAIGQVHAFLVRHPGVSPWDLAVLCSDYGAIVLWDCAVREHMRDDERDDRVAAWVETRVAS